MKHSDLSDYATRTELLADLRANFSAQELASALYDLPETLVNDTSDLNTWAHQTHDCSFTIAAAGSWGMPLEKWLSQAADSTFTIDGQLYETAEEVQAALSE